MQQSVIIATNPNNSVVSKFNNIIFTLIYQTTNLMKIKAFSRIRCKVSIIGRITAGLGDEKVNIRSFFDGNQSGVVR